MQRKNAEVERLSKDIDKSEELTEEITTESVTDKSDIEDISEEIKEKPKKKTKTKETDSVSVQTFNRKKKKSWIKWVIIAAVIAGIVGFIIYRAVKVSKQVAEALAAGTTQEAEITRMDITNSISTTGTIQSKDVRTLTSPLAGVKIEEVNYKVGDMVEEGAVVVTFSVEDINKKIGQLEEDITEAKQAKALDSKDRDYTHVNNYDLQTYAVATSYERFQKAEKDLQKAKDDFAKACEETGDYKRKYEEAKEKIGGKKDELEDTQVAYKQWQDSAPDLTQEANIRKNLDYQNRISDLQSKIGEYNSTISAYDTGIDTYIKAEESAQTAVDTAQRNYDLAYVDFNKAGYDAGFSNAKTDYNYNKGNLQANDAVKNLERQKEQNEDTLENYIVTAPISGLVTEVNAQEGNGYQANTGALMTIQAVDVFEVATQIDEYDINNVKLGQRVVIMTDATGDDELEGIVSFVAPTATRPQTATGSTSNTFEVKIDVLNKDERLRLGMSAKINIIVDTHRDVLAVPYDAIEQKEGGANVIYVLDKTASNAAPEENKSGGIPVIGIDGLMKGANKEDSAPAAPENTSPLASVQGAREVPVQIGLEGDYFTEVISQDIKEGMTVLVNSQAGELPDDFTMMMEGGY